MLNVTLNSFANQRKWFTKFNKRKVIIGIVNSIQNEDICNYFTLLNMFLTGAVTRNLERLVRYLFVIFIDRLIIIRAITCHIDIIVVTIWILIDR